MLKIFDKNHNAIGHIVKYRDDKIESDISTGDRSLSFTYLARHHNLQNEMYIQTREDEYVIKEISESSDGFPQIVAALNLEELEAKPWQTFSVTNVTIDEAARTVLAGTGWTIGECDVAKRRNAGMVKVTSLGVIQKLCTAFMCEPVFDTINKTVSFYEHRGEDKGVYFMSSLNLKKLQKKSSSYDFYTRIIPIGADGLTIESVNDGKDYLENHQYSDKVRTCIWEDTSYTDAQALKDDAEKKLEDMSKPEMSFSADIRDLAKQKPEYSILSFNLGDTVTLIDPATGAREKQRIIRMVQHPHDHDKDSCEIANAFLTFGEMQEKLRAAADIVNTTITNDGKIYVSDILKFEQGITGSPTVTGMRNNISTMQGGMAEIKQTVGELEANVLRADEADLKYATIEQLEVTDQTVHSIQGDYAKFKSTVTDEFAAQTGIIDNLSGEFATYKNQVAGQFTAFGASITDLQAKDAELESALIGTAKVVDLDAVRTRTQQLESDVAGINTLVNGNLTSDNIHSMVITGNKFTVENGFIKSAMIDSLAADKITGLDINTTKLTVHSNDGKSTWIDNTIQISDADRVRVQIGKDASGDYNIYIWDKSGNLMFDPLYGVQEFGIKKPIIRNDMVSDTANIAGHKLDIEDVIKEVNGATTTIKGTRIKLDEQNQTLDMAFSTLKTYAEGVNSRTESNETAISVAQGQISTLISNSTVVKDGKTVLLKDAYNSTVADVNSMKTTIGEHTSLIDEQSGEILAVQTKANTIESDLNGTKQTVSAVQSDLSGTKSRVATVETGLDGLKTRVSSAETAITKKADGTTVNALTSRVATAESTLDGFGASLTATNKTVSDNYTALTGMIDGIEIGGRNLALKTKEFISPWKGINSDVVYTDVTTGIKYRKVWHGSNTSWVQYISQHIDFEPNTQYTVSLLVRKNTDIDPILNVRNDRNDAITYFFNNFKVVSREWTRISGTAITHKNSANEPLVIYALLTPEGGNDTGGALNANTAIDIALVKVEKSTKASDWTPAPEDTESDIAATNATVATHTETLSTHAVKIAANENAIALKVATSDFNSYKTTVNGEITSAKTRLSTAESSITAMKSQISLKVEQTDIDTAVNNIQVGGRNLIISSEIVRNVWINSTGKEASSYVCMSTGFINVQPGESITLQYWQPSNNNTGTNRAWTGTLMYFDSNKAYIGGYDSTYFTDTHKIIQETVPAGASYVRATFQFPQPLSVTPNNWDNTSEFKWKLEKGNRATDWTPAPEDVDAKFANYSTTTQMQSAIDIAKTSITQSVSETYATKTALNTANSNITGLTSRMSAAESKLTKDSLVTTIGSYYATLDDIEIGGRNLVRNSAVKIENNAYQIRSYSLSQDLTSGEKYTATIWGNLGSGKEYFGIWMGGGYTSIAHFKLISTGIYRCTFTMPSYVSGDGRKDIINIYAVPSSVTVVSRIDKIKLEKGTKATDWTPAPEDTMEYIASVETIATQTKDKFNWLVKSGTSATDFTLTDRTATLIASAINLKGLVTFSGLDSAAQGKITTAQSTADTAKSNAATALNTANTAVSNAAAAQSTANTAAANATAALSLIEVKDTRSDNQTPQWYMTNYPRKIVREFKNCSKIGLSVSSTYCMLETKVQWTDSSGGFPTQVASVGNDNKVYKRVGISATAWSAWVSADQVIADWCYNNNLTYINGGKIYAHTVTTTRLATDAIKSLNYAYSSGDYSTAGTFLDLANGSIRSKNFAIKSDGSVYMNGILRSYSSNELLEISDGIIYGKRGNTVDSLIDTSAYYADGYYLVLKNNNGKIILQADEVNIEGKIKADDFANNAGQHLVKTAIVDGNTDAAGNLFLGDKNIYGAFPDSSDTKINFVFKNQYGMSYANLSSWLTGAILANSFCVVRICFN